MTKHLHYKTEYCWNCGNVAVGHCNKCGMPICTECGGMYGGKCDVCWEEQVEMQLMLIGNINNGYEISASNNRIHF